MSCSDFVLKKKATNAKGGGSSCSKCSGAGGRDMSTMPLITACY